MKTVKADVPFFLNKDNMQYLLKGSVITNLDEVHSKMLFKSGNNIYVPRNDDPNHPVAFPTIDDTIVAKALRYKTTESGTNVLEIEIIDSLYYHKLRQPCIKVNGVCEIDEDHNITITKVTRLTLADRQPEMLEEVF